MISDQHISGATVTSEFDVAQSPQSKAYRLIQRFRMVILSDTVGRFLHEAGLSAFEMARAPPCTICVQSADCANRFCATSAYPI
jgi:hypothetical protein